MSSGSTPARQRHQAQLSDPSGRLVRTYTWKEVENMSKNEKAALLLVGALVVGAAAHRMAAKEAAALGIPALGLAVLGWMVSAAME